jgi:hypothetical protein
MQECSSITSPIHTDACAKSRNTYGSKPDLLPPYLNNTDPLEPEDIPLQLALLTMEAASTRQKLAAMAELLAQMAALMSPDFFEV